MRVDGHADIRTLEAALDAVDDDARRLLEGLTAEQGIWRPSPDTRSIAHCLDHLAAAQFFARQDLVRAFLRKYADIDLAGVHFPNPFIPVVRFSLATGLHVIAAHDRRHIWQAWNVRKALQVRHDSSLLSNR